MPEHSDDPGMGGRGVARQALPECGEHCGECSRCGIEIKVKPRHRKTTTPEERKERKTVQIRTPVGEDQIIPELVDLVREKRAEQMGWSSSVPAHYIIVYALAKDLQ